MDLGALARIVDRYKADPESVYNTWFVGDAQRTKAFRAIRQGVRDTIDSIAAGTFGNDFRGSPLEFVLTAITEQKQVFEGAAHPFYWKPKLRIPDIYENAANQRRFGAFLQACACATREDQLVSEMSRLAAAQIKGLGPAVANILYFLHPTLVPPSNTAMVRGFNTLFRDGKKLGSWESYLSMREAILRVNAEPPVRSRLSKDLGAFAGLLFEVGAGRLALADGAGGAGPSLQVARDQADRATRLRHAEVIAEAQEETEHTRMQYLLIKIGRALKCDVYVARNDRHRSCDGQSFAQLTVPELPGCGWPAEVTETVGLIDVIWLQPGTGEIVSAFEVEQSTSIYSGILRMQDLALSVPGCTCHFYLVAPDRREREVMAQLGRPSLRGSPAGSTPMAFIPFGELGRHCDGLCTFGDDYTAVRKIARAPLPAP